MKLGAFLIILIVGMAVLAPLFTSFGPSGTITQSTSEALASKHMAPSTEHWFGTDELGRDVFARMLYGARISLGVGIVSRLIAVIIGGTIGAAAGYFGGKVDFVITRMIEIVLAFPSLILAIAISVALGPGLTTVFIAIVVVSWVDVAVLVRSVAAGIAKKDFVTAAVALGDSPMRILFRQIIPNCYSTLLVTFSFGIASAVMVEASLSYLGLGSSSVGGYTSWGWMIYTAQNYLSKAPWAAFGPGILLAISVLGWNLLGDALRDKLDVKSVENI